MAISVVLGCDVLSIFKHLDELYHDVGGFALVFQKEAPTVVHDRVTND